MNLLPAFIRHRLAHRPNLRQILDNIGWLFIDKVLHICVGLIVSVWLARYLGPEQLGQLNYAVAFAGLFAALSALGLKDIIIRDMVSDPAGANTTLGTAFVLRLLGSILALLLMIVAITFLRPDEPLIKTIVAIFGLGFVIRSTEVIKYWFESLVRSRYTVWVESSFFLIFAAVKVVMILGGASLMAFVLVMLAETALISIGMIFIYLRKYPISLWRFRTARAKSLMHDSFPLLLSAGFIAANMNIDKVMIGSMLDDTSVGIYSVSSQLYNYINSMFVIVELSIFPAIIKSKERGEAAFHGDVTRVYRYLFVFSLLLLPVMYFLAPFVINLMFGQAYNGSIEVFLVYMLLMPFSLITRGQGAYLKIENLTSLIMWRQFLIMIINILCNLALIPLMGPKGAALSIVLAFIAAGIITTVAAPTRYSLGKITFSIIGFKGKSGTNTGKA